MKLHAVFILAISNVSCSASNWFCDCGVPYRIEPERLTSVVREASLGNGEAAYALSLYFTIDQDKFEEGRDWLKVAAENGHIDALYSYATYLGFGAKNIKFNRCRAVYWFDKYLLAAKEKNDVSNTEDELRKQLLKLCLD